MSSMDGPFFSFFGECDCLYACKVPALIISQYTSLFSLVSIERTETVEGEEEPKRSELKHEKYFGEEVLGPGENTYSATVTSLSNTTCWKIDKMTVKRTLGKLRMKRRASGSMGTVA